ncbi:NADPH:quinone oxidoreductase-like [Telopea speciosissima]|uniref:NADPH:quinone oxidoreductase-like n=1 Tax=Telopea speciosissima TaxID=54955 RepID=UPI001CC61E7C|nr:NADPH:quinone oxidoreductase-like [Telopea speciosissima]
MDQASLINLKTGEPVSWEKLEDKNVLNAVSFSPLWVLILSLLSGFCFAAQQICKDSLTGMEIELVDISELPLLNTDLEVDGICPPVVEAFRQKIAAADSILFASPEYNYSITPALKNAVDWGSRPPNVWGGKAATIVSAGGGFGGGRSHYHLRQVGVYVDIHFINKPEFFVPAFNPPPKFDGEGNLIDPMSKEILQQILVSLQEFTLRLSGNAQ